MWCGPLPKGLVTSQGPHGLVYTGQPHRDWVRKKIAVADGVLVKLAYETHNYVCPVLRRERSDDRK